MFYFTSGLICQPVGPLNRSTTAKSFSFNVQIIMLRSIFTVIACVTIIANVHGQDSSDGASATKPGPEHKYLMAFVGTWELTVEGVEEKGSAVIKPILGGRFITEDIKLPFGDFDMDWHGVIGYDRVSELPVKRVILHPHEKKFLSYLRQQSYTLKLLYAFAKISF
jgi:hypothetical protein